MSQRHIRRACQNDLSRIRSLHAASLRELAGDHYGEHQIDAVIRFGTIDDDLVAEDRYFVSEDAGSIIATGGWSTSPPPYAINLPTDEGRDGTPIIRAVYVNPSVARRGHGRAMMTHLEQDIAAGGFDRVRLTATLSAVPLYLALGYRLDCVDQMTLPCGTPFGCAPMSKVLDAVRRHAA